jgi:hypothetical protein
VIWLLACLRRRLLKEGFLPPILFFSSSLSSTTTIINTNHFHQEQPFQHYISSRHSILHLFEQSTTSDNHRQSSTFDNHRPPTIIHLRQSSTFSYFTYHWAHPRKDWDNLQVRHKISHTVVSICLPISRTRGVSITGHSTCSEVSGMQDSYESLGITNPPTLVGGSLPRSRGQVDRVRCKSLEQVIRLVPRGAGVGVDPAGCDSIWGVFTA